MAIRDFMGLNVSEFKKYIKAAKKNNTKSIVCGVNRERTAIL